MFLILLNKFETLYKKGGKPLKLTVEDKRYLALKYVREYRIAAE
jgi:hypothetical protein